MFQVFPILAVDVGAIVGLIVLVLSVLGWLVNLIKGEEGAAPKPRPRQANAGGKDLRSEIQDFLDELTETRNTKTRPRPQPVEEEVIILEEDEPVRKPVRPAKQDKQRKKGKPQEPKPAPAVAARGPLSNVQQQHLPSSRLGAGVQEHVATHMASGQVTAQAQEFIGHRVEQAVQHDLGASTAAPGAVPALKVATLHPALTFLGKPGTIRDAIVLSEILQPPKSLRRRRD